MGLPHPLRAEKHVFEAAPGSTIDDVLVELTQQSGVHPRLLARAAVYVGDHQIPKGLWSTTRPKPGVTVSIRALPGDDFGSLLVQIAGFALAAAVPHLAPTLTTLQVLGVRIAIGVTTSLIAQAIAPAPAQHLSSSNDPPPDAADSIQGISNEARPYGVLPNIYGRLVNYHPPLAALPYTEFNGNEQRLRMLFTAGYGPVATSDYKVGQTLFSTLNDATLVARDGSGTTNTGLFPGQVREESLSTQLRQIDGYSERRTEVDTDEVVLDITFPSGLFRVSSRNVKFDLRVSFQVQYRAAGGGAWANAPLSLSGGTIVLEGNGQFAVWTLHRGTLRRAVRVVFPARGQYDVRIKRVTKDDQSEIPGSEDQFVTTEDSYWTAIRSLKNDPPVNVATGLCMLAVRVQASDQLNGVLKTFNMTVQRHLPVWNGATWTTQATRNPAWAFVDALTGPANARAISTSRIDLDQMLTWASYCDSKGITFDGAIEREMSVWDLIHDIAATGHASPTFVDGQYSVVIDQPQSQIVQHFSPRNSWGFKGTKLFGDFPHALKVRFPNEATLHQVDERIVYDTGYSASNATKFEVLDLPYTTSSDVAWRTGRRALAAARLRPEVFTIETDLEHLRCTRGDLVRLVHDVPLIGVSVARVSAVTLDGGSNMTGFSTDAALPMEGGSSYAFRFRLADGTSIVHDVATVAGEQTAFTFDTAIPSGSDMPAVGDLALFGVSGEESLECLVRSIEPRSDLSAVVTLIPYSAAVYTADAGTIPAYEPLITLPPVINRSTPSKPALLSVTSDENAAFVSNTGTVQPQILLAFTYNPNTGAVPAETLQVQWRRAGIAADYSQTLLPATATEFGISPVETGVTYDIRLRAVSQFGATSGWVTALETVVGLVAPPPDIDQMFREGDYLTWAYPSPPLDFAGFRLKAHFGTNTNWMQAVALHAGLLSDSKFDISSLDGTRTILAKAVDVAGNESVNAAVVTINLGDPITSNLLLTQSEAPGFSGTITGGSVVSNELVADTDSDPMFWGSGTDTFWGSDGSTFWPTITYSALSYVAAYDPVTNHLGATVKLSLDVTGDYTVEMREVDSPTFWGSDGSTFWGSDSDTFWAESSLSEWVAWPGQLGPLDDDTTCYEFRVSIVEGATRGTITEFDILVDVPDIVEYFEDVSIAATGTPRLSLTKTYRAIRIVNVTVQDDAGTAVTARIKDKDESLGPNIETLDAAGARAAGTIDATVIGY